ncbi:predicted protein [Plenodomus lingam JN3]|uniref:Predicted protein n=1 Tax=Leptosphaeria maculans (strain JN3 / isolate v23.1.3 / race Av1-4-5-6-7-8) TaxID=985895 RepID=E5A081_LEPMJ|nr:predicted protein [Plenodomus lingam JN3]CBX96941.1 predicted protein [Plenodomus lingam JN3]
MSLSNSQNKYPTTPYQIRVVRLTYSGAVIAGALLHTLDFFFAKR